MGVVRGRVAGSTGLPSSPDVCHRTSALQTLKTALHNRREHQRTKGASGVSLRARAGPQDGGETVVGQRCMAMSSACEGHQDSRDPVLAKGTEGSSQSRASWGWGLAEQPSWLPLSGGSSVLRHGSG